MITVVGIDLSLTSTGLAALHRDGTITTGTITSRGTKADTLTDRCRRLQRIETDLWAWKSHRGAPMTRLAIIEGPSFGQARQGGTHDRSGLWWAIVRSLIVGGVQVVEVAPSTRAKYLAGKGNAPKDACLAAAIRRYPDLDITGNDVADAVALMAIGARLLGQPIEESLPQTHLAALDKLPAVTPPQLDTSDGYGTADLVQAAHEAEEATC